MLPSDRFKAAQKLKASLSERGVSFDFWLMVERLAEVMNVRDLRRVVKEVCRAGV